MAASLTFALLCVVASTISESDVVNAVSSKTVISLTSWTTAPTCGAKGTNDTGLIQQVGSCFVNEDDGTHVIAALLFYKHIFSFRLCQDFHWSSRL